jgi:hypoxanthine-guanine phosphoribosyltransferase
MELIETEKWIILVPRINENIIKKKILILDDFCITGNSLKKIKKYFTDKKILKIKTASLFVSDVCLKNENCPDYFVSQESINLKTPFDKIR